MQVKEKPLDNNNLCIVGVKIASLELLYIPHNNSISSNFVPSYRAEVIDSRISVVLPIV